MSKELFDCLPSVGRLGDHAYVALAIEQCNQAFPHYGVIVCH
jgi:hypothetical protein